MLARHTDGVRKRRSTDIASSRRHRDAIPVGPDCEAELRPGARIGHRQLSLASPRRKAPAHGHRQELEVMLARSGPQHHDRQEHRPSRRIGTHVQRQVEEPRDVRADLDNENQTTSNYRERIGRAEEDTRRTSRNLPSRNTRLSGDCARRGRPDVSRCADKRVADAISERSMSRHSEANAARSRPEGHRPLDHGRPAFTSNADRQIERRHRSAADRSAVAPPSETRASSNRRRVRASRCSSATTVRRRRARGPRIGSLYRDQAVTRRRKHFWRAARRPISSGGEPESSTGSTMTRTRKTRTSRSRRCRLLPSSSQQRSAPAGSSPQATAAQESSCAAGSSGRRRRRRRLNNAARTVAG